MKMLYGRKYERTPKLELWVASMTVFYALVWAFVLLLKVVLFVPVLLFQGVMIVLEWLDEQVFYLDSRSWRWLTVCVPFHYWNKAPLEDGGMTIKAGVS